MTLPDELLECEDVRLIPKIETQKDVADYLLVLHGGYMDCYEKLQKIRDLNGK